MTRVWYYKVVFESSKAAPLTVEASIIDFSNPDVVTLLSEDDQHIVAAVPKAKLLYIVERKTSGRVVSARSD